MKWQAVIVLLAIALSVLAPPSLPMMIMHDGHAEIGVLDICHAAAPAIAAGGEMPCLNCSVFDQQPAVLVTYTIQQKPFFSQLLCAFDTEQPPQS